MLNPSYITNPEYRQYVSFKNKEIGSKLSVKRDSNNDRKTIFFNYYDSVVRNSHLNPREKTNFIQYYIQPPIIKKSALLHNIDKKANIPNKILPLWE